jgi:steroid delta-isomerase-like uncharacterized protein
VTLLRTAFPDLLFKVEDEVAEGDVVVDRWSATGTSKGPFNGAPPSGKQFRIEGIGWYRLKSGQFIENRVNEDTLGLLQQIGALPASANSGGEKSGVTSDDNRALVRRFWEEIWNQGNLSTVDAIVSPDFTLEGPSFPDPLRGPNGLKGWVTTVRTAFPDVRFTVDEEVAEGDKIVNRWSARGTHLGPLMDIPPSGKAILLRGMTLFTVVGNKVSVEYAVEDMLGMLQQIGAVGAPGKPTT